jgi:glycosyltransferase involved in cell wall biosynthesis
VVILTEIIAPYRVPVFNALAREEDVDLRVIFLAETDPVLRQWRVYKEEIDFPYDVLRSLRWRAGRLNVLLNWGLGSVLSAASPDSIICGGYNYLASWEALLWARRHEVPFLLWSESNRQDERRGHVGIEFLKHEFLRRCAGFVVPGRSAFEYLESLGVSASKIVTAPDAVDIEFFSRGAEAARREGGTLRKTLVVPERYILYAGRLVAEKGVFDLLEAYARLESNLRLAVGLVFAGDGIAKPQLQERARQIAPGAVHFPGFAHRERLAQLYGLAEVLVLPTHSDPWGLVVNEAMACGLPIIATNVAGCADDLVEDGWNGYVVPPHSPECLRPALEAVLGDGERSRAMGQHSFERIQGYSPGACAKGLAEAASRFAMEGR